MVIARIHWATDACVLAMTIRRKVIQDLLRDSNEVGGNTILSIFHAKVLAAKNTFKLFGDSKFERVGSVAA